MSVGKSVKIVSFLLVLIFIATSNIAYSSDSTLRVPITTKYEQKRIEEAQTKVTGDKLTSNATISPALNGGRYIGVIVASLSAAGAVDGANLTTLKKEFTEYNAQGALADFLAGLPEQASSTGVDVKLVDAGIGEVLSSIGLNRVESEQDIIVLPASEEMGNRRSLKFFLQLNSVKGKAVVIVSDNEETLSSIRAKFLENTGKNLEELAWLRVLKGANLESLRAVYNNFGLDVQCSLEKVKDRALADAIKRGI